MLFIKNSSEILAPRVFQKQPSEEPELTLQHRRNVSQASICGEIHLRELMRCKGATSEKLIRLCEIGSGLS